MSRIYVFMCTITCLIVCMCVYVFINMRQVDMAKSMKYTGLYWYSNVCVLHDVNAGTSLKFAPWREALALRLLTSKIRPITSIGSDRGSLLPGPWRPCQTYVRSWCPSTATRSSWLPWSGRPGKGAPPSQTCPSYGCGGWPGSGKRRTGTR